MRARWGRRRRQGSARDTSFRLGGGALYLAIRWTRRDRPMAHPRLRRRRLKTRLRRLTEVKVKGQAAARSWSWTSKPRALSSTTSRRARWCGERRRLNQSPPRSW